MRIFLGIKIPEQTIQVIEDALAPVKEANPHYRWGLPSNYHITVHFFGDVTNVDPLVHRIEELLFAQEAFDLKLYSGGIFIGDAITLYVDFYRSRGIEEISRVIEEDVNDGKIYRFIPHITVARYKVPSKQQYLLAKKKMEGLTFEHEFRVREVTLFQSILTNKTPVYTPIHEFPLIEE